MFPALASAICDIGILYLGHRNYLLEEKFLEDGLLDVDDANHYYDDYDDDTSRRIYHYGYLVCLAAIRLFLLLVPLPYHSFLGKALRCPIIYRLFYGITLFAIAIHSLTLLMVDTSSLSSLLKAIASFEDSGRLHHVLVTRSLWVAILLTLVSTLSHFALFFHVRSTAPIDAEFFGEKRRQPTVLLYYAKERNQLNNSMHHYANGNEDPEREGLLSQNGDDDIGLPMGNNDEQPPVFGPNSLPHSNSARALQDISNKIVMELQVRLRKAKGQWTKRLEEYQTPLRAAASNPDHLSLLSAATPFKVILELFAGDNNFNHANNDHGSIQKLDSVYERDDGAALMLFVPQLLSFLLHSAYESSHPLEEWILETCKKNLFFAHKCYWFLRAWSLETSSVAVRPSIHNSSSGEGGGEQPPQMVTRLSHSSSLTSFATQEEDSNNDSKLLPEERAVIEELMRKIMKCGEEPARLLHFGSAVAKLESPETTSMATTETNLFPNESSSSDVQNYSSSSITPTGAAKASLLPIDPSNGLPSRKHFECLAAKRTHGFLPLDNGAAISASYNQSVLNGNPCGASYFDSCPVFMDALINIADNLFKVPKDLRKEEFKKQLLQLELEALPCNEIYIPLQNLHHRVWRIVADESIPLGTKERVPCIVCLEVIEYTPEQSKEREISKLLSLTKSIRQPTTASEREMVEAWRNSPRDPYRRETALNRVTHEMNKLPNIMKESMQEMQLSMQEMKLSIRQGISHIQETVDENEVFWTAPNTPVREEKSETQALNGEQPTKLKVPGSPDLKQPASPRRTAQPLTPKTPRSAIQQGAMGQWTKSPAPRGALEIANTALPDLSAVNASSNSYQAANSGDGGNMNRRRISRSGNTGISSRANKFDMEGNGHNDSSGFDDEDENDYNGQQTNGGITPAYTNGHAKPPIVPTKPPPVVFKENWKEKEDRLRSASAFGNHPGWKLLPVLVKSNDDLRQEQLASQLIQRMALILARDQVPVWLCPYEIVALDASGGIIEAIPDTISLTSLKKNDPDYTDLNGFFEQYFFEADMLADAKANFCESLAAYSMVCFLLQIKDRHNGNILLDNRGHLIHIDFGFFFLSSPGKNTGFESAPFKLTREFVTVLGGPDSHLFGVFRTLCYRTFLSLRKHCLEIIMLVEMLQLGNEDLNCFRGRPEDAIRELRQRFRLDLNDRACLEYVNALIDESLENWRTNWYDRYQRYCVGVL